MFGSNGLVAVKTADLKLLLGYVHREELSCPIDRIGLATVGLLRLGDDLAVLAGLDQRATRSVLVAVLCERRSGAR